MNSNWFERDITNPNKNPFTLIEQAKTKRMRVALILVRMYVLPKKMATIAAIMPSIIPKRVDKKAIKFFY